VRPEVTEENVRRWLARNVRARRKELGLTLKQAGKRAEMSWTHWQRVEYGEMNVTIQTIVRIANVLDMKPSELLAQPPKRKE
jgi:transcriptional regulator with XRE-family HTH domain